MQKYLFIKAKKSYVKVHFTDIILIEGAHNYLKIVTEKVNYFVIMSMKKMEKLLPSNIFVRIHRSYIVSLDSITEFDNDKVHLKDRTLPIGSCYKTEFRKSVLIIDNDYATSVREHRLTMRSQSA